MTGPTDDPQQLHLVDLGPTGGRPVLLLHGGGVAGWMWRPLADQLDGVRLLIPDLPGHDHSQPIPYRGHGDVVAILAAMVEQLGLEQVGLGQVDVVGFSLGAQLAVLLATSRPDLVASVVVISAQAEPLRRSGPLLALIGATAGLAGVPWFARLQARELFVSEPLWPDYLRTARSISKQTLVTTVRENSHFTPPRGWSEFVGPALVLVGEQERRLMRRSAQVLQSQRPQTELEVVAGCGHGVPLQRPEWLARRLQSWWGENVSQDLPE